MVKRAHQLLPIRDADRKSPDFVLIHRRHDKQQAHRFPYPRFTLRSRRAVFRLLKLTSGSWPAKGAIASLTQQEHARKSHSQASCEFPPLTQISPEVYTNVKLARSAASLLAWEEEKNTPNSYNKPPVSCSCAVVQQNNGSV